MVKKWRRRHPLDQHNHYETIALCSPIPSLALQHQRWRHPHRSTQMPVACCRFRSARLQRYRRQCRLRIWAAVPPSWDNRLSSDLRFCSCDSASAVGPVDIWLLYDWRIRHSCNI